MSDIKERIKLLLEELFDNNASEFGRNVEFSDTAIKNYIKGQSNPGFEFIYGLCSKLGINPTWLILGIGERDLPKNISVNGNGNSVGVLKIGNNNSNITQIMHSNDMLANENEALKREIALLKEMVELYKNQSKN